jgi:hypothetical protein
MEKDGASQVHSLKRVTVSGRAKLENHQIFRGKKRPLAGFLYSESFPMLAPGGRNQYSTTALVHD